MTVSRLINRNVVAERGRTACAWNNCGKHSWKSVAGRGKT